MGVNKETVSGQKVKTQYGFLNSSQQEVEVVGFAVKAQLQAAGTPTGNRPPISSH